MSTTRIKTLFFAFLKAIGWGLVSVLALLFFASLIIRLPQVQSIVVSKIENTLKNSLGTELTIGHAYINFPKSIEVKSFYLEDLQSDTLLYFKSLEVNTDLWQLTQRTVEFNTITLSGLRSNIKRAANSEIFNFQFISDAFHSENSSSEIDSEPWSLGVESIKSNDIKIQFQDETSTAYLSTSWNKLDIEIDNLNIQEPKVLINSIFVEGGHIDFDKNESTTPSKKAEGDSSFELNVNEVTIENTKFEFNDTYQTLNGLIGNFQLETQKFSLNENLLVIDLLALENSTIDYRKKTRPINERLEIKNSPNKWLIAANKVQFENNSIQAKLDSSDYDKKFFNPNNFIITNLDVDVNNTFYSSESMKAEIGEVSFLTDDREVLLESKLDLTSTELDLKEIDLYINNTLLQATANASFSSLNSIMSSNTQLKLELSSSELLMSDLSYFIPKVDFSPAPEKVTLSTIIEGSMKQLNIAELSVNTPLSSICFQGTISDLTHPSDLFYSIDTFQINSHRQEMLNFLSDSLNDIITLPDIMDVYIKGQGSLSDYTGSIALNSSYGGINLNDIKVNLRETVPTYSGNIESSGFDFGRLLQQSHFDSLIIDLSVFGQGTSLDNLNTTLKGSLQHIILNEYAYDTLSIEASLNESLIELQINLRDEHAGFSLTGALEDRIGLHKNNLNFQLTKAHLKSLNFSRVPLDIKGRMQTDFTTKNFQGFNGKISIIEFEANNGLDTYKVDSLVVHSLNQEE